jgi:hypothetical protein
LPELFSYDDVLWPLISDQAAQQLLGIAVSVTHRSQVRLGLDREIERAEATQGHLVGTICHLQSELEVFCHGPQRSHSRLPSRCPDGDYSSTEELEEVQLPETVFGLPLHPLVVHGAAALVPIASLLAIIVAVNPDRRSRWGLLTWLLATAALGAAFAARLSGENFKESTFSQSPTADLIQHADYGLAAVWFVLALWLAVSSLLLLDVDRKRRDGFGSPVLPAIVSVITIVTAMAATGQVMLTVWTGAEAHWSSIVG